MRTAPGGWLVVGLVVAATAGIPDTGSAQVPGSSANGSASFCSIPAEFQPATPDGYAAGKDWLTQSDRVDFDYGTYRKFSYPRPIPLGLLQRVGEISGTPVFAEAGYAGPHRVIYVLFSADCKFQVYQRSS